MKSSPPRPCVVNDPSRHGTCSIPQSRSSASLLEHSPLLDEVLHQITNSKESILDIRTQLAECQLVTTRSHAILQREVETYRERKQQEDAARFELKTRTKLLDDSKRGAEGAKKDAEKSLKAIQLVRDSAGHQLESLQQKILALQSHLLEDRDFIVYCQRQSLEHATNDTLEEKKADIQAAERSVAILNQRSRELEYRLSSERERLRILRQKSENQKSYSPFLEDMDLGAQHHDRSHPLPPAIALGSSLNHISLVTPDGGANLDSQLLHHSRTGDLYSTCSAALVRNVETNRNFLSEVHKDAPSDSSQEIFTPVESEVVSTTSESGLILPRDRSDNVSASLGGDSDSGTERNWYRSMDSCNGRYQGGHANLSSIPTFIPVSSDSDRSFDAHFQPYDSPSCARSPKFDVEHTNWTQPLDVNSRAPHNIPGTDCCDTTNILNQSQSTCSLVSTTSLNINEFSLLDNPSFELPNDPGNTSANSTFDALNPNGLGSALVTRPSSQSFLRAFAPSPAEREALQKALSGSTNASLERLPSFSAVGDLPSSPTGSHAGGHSHSLRDLRNFLPTWLKTFPRSGAVKFSPWEDEDLKDGDQQVTTKPE